MSLEVLGLRSMNGISCALSRFRDKCKSKSILHTREHLAKIAVHEIGHTLGLDHRLNFGCLMEELAHRKHINNVRTNHERSNKREAAGLNQI